MPALKNSEGEWARSSEDKANLLARTFSKKWTLPVVSANEYSDIFSMNSVMDSQGGFLLLRTRNLLKILKNLDKCSGTGPDMLGTYILKFFILVLNHIYVIKLKCLSWRKYRKLVSKYSFQKNPYRKKRLNRG